MNRAQVNLWRAMQARRLAEKRVEMILREGFPVGSEITFYTSQTGPQRAVVTMHCCDDRIQVRNLRTGKTRFLYAYRLIPP
jgi:hypothetical protein